MLDRAHSGASESDSGREPDIGDVIKSGRNRRAQVNPPKRDSVIGIGRMQGRGDAPPGMQADANAGNR